MRQKEPIDTALTAEEYQRKLLSYLSRRITTLHKFAKESKQGGFLGSALESNVRADALVHLRRCIELGEHLK
jgi:hypothetical protein